MKNLGSAGHAPSLQIIPWLLHLQLRKKSEKISVRVVEKCPHIPVAVVQYTSTHKQYTEQHNETEYTEWNIYNNKNIVLFRVL
jgi:hypothetical protein